MALTRERKEAAVEKLKEATANAGSVVFVQFKGVTSEEANTLRSRCAEEEVGYLVAKKTLIRHALATSKIEGEMAPLEGEIAVAYGADTLAPARAIGKCTKDLDGRLTIVGGIFEGVFTSAEHMQAIADIPPMETLYAQFLMLLNAPMQQFVSVLDQIAEKKD